MHIEKLIISDFRNYKNQSVEFSPFVNLFMGMNGMGKTNLLEALCICSMGKSSRTSKDKELIRHDAEQAKIRVLAKKSFGTDRVDIILDKNQNKRVAINGLPITRMGELMGVVQTVFFSPDELKIVKDSPLERRRFIDIALSQISKNYFYLISRYARAMAQRNKLLKSGGANNDSLSAWDVQLAQAGASIIKTRRGFVSALHIEAAKQHAFLTENAEKLELVYESVNGETKEEIEANLLAEFIETRERDMRLGHTHAGPHRDDIGIYIDETDARKFGSQGQQRTAALAIKLAQVELTSQKGEPPVLLLDDVMGELDLMRQRKLIERVKGMQTIITATHLDNETALVLGAHKIFNIAKGEVL